MLSIIARKANEADLAQLVLRETSTFGVRVQPISRYEAGREMRIVSTKYGNIPVKVKIISGERIQAAPEYDACVQTAAQYGIPLMEVYHAALIAAENEISEK